MRALVPPFQSPPGPTLPPGVEFSTEKSVTPPADDDAPPAAAPALPVTLAAAPPDCPGNAAGNRLSIRGRNESERSTDDRKLHDHYPKAVTIIIVYARAARWFQQKGRFQVVEPTRSRQNPLCEVAEAEGLRFDTRWSMRATLRPAVCLCAIAQT